MVDPAAERARDIAVHLHEAEESPYRNLVKLPGAPPRKFGIALSTMVSSLKPLVEAKGPLEQIGVSELEVQKRVVMNFLTVLRKKYGTFWDDRENVFQYGAGFAGAMDFFRSRLIPFCNAKRSFEVSTMSDALSLSPTDAIIQSAVKGMSGGQAAATVAEQLVERFHSDMGTTGALRI